MLSQPPDTNLRGPPAALNGAQLTALHPIVWALGIFVDSHWFSELSDVIDIAPSEEPAANTKPNSWGAQHTELTEES